jgi:glycogen operon protein
VLEPGWTTVRTGEWRVGVTLDSPDWSEHSHSLAITLDSLRGRFRLHGMFNAYWEPLAFELPPSNGQSWRRCIDTALPSPDDIRRWSESAPVTTTSYLVAPRSVVVFALGLQPAGASDGQLMAQG